MARWHGCQLSVTVNFAWLSTLRVTVNFARDCQHLQVAKLTPEGLQQLFDEHEEVSPY